MRILRRLLCFVVLAGCSYAADVKLTWTASTSSGVVGYNVYYSTVSGGPYTLYAGYGTVGNATTYTLNELPPGAYYFVTTAVDNSGDESAYSNEAATSFGPRCDINHNGSVNVLDWQLLANVILGVTQCPGPLSCDLNQDGSVNVLDWQLLANVILGVTTCPY